MPVQVINNVAWLYPQNVSVADIAAQLATASPEDLATQYSITVDDWDALIPPLRNLIGTGAPLPHDVANAVRLAAINTTLTSYALSFPNHATARELLNVESLLRRMPPAMDAIRDALFLMVMEPRFRALQLIGRFMNLSPFDEFAYIVDSATISFYRGNRPSAFLCLLPVIEGVLLRWQGYVGLSGRKPTFGQSLTYIIGTRARQLYPSLPLLFGSWVDASSTILRDHLFRDSSLGPSVDNFNRHLALHLLDDQPFATRDNIVRAFMLLDLLSDIQLAEKHQADPRFNVPDDKLSAHIAAYSSAALVSVGIQPEQVLAIHPRCQ